MPYVDLDSMHTPEKFMRILIVDDEPLVALTLTLIFERQGFQVDTVHNALEGLRSALQNRPDLILCDIDMPGRSGMELMKDLARELPTTPILVLTGYYHVLTRVQEIADGMQQRVNVLTKPCPPTELLRQAGTMLSAA